MTNDKRRRAPVGHLEAAFGVSLDPELLERALTHRSYAYENGGCPPTSGWSSSATRSSAS